MSPSPVSDMQDHPVIGCTSFRRRVDKPSSFELVGIKRSYVEAIVAAGGVPLLIPIGLGAAQIEFLFQRIDGLLLPGGGDVDPSCYTDDARHSTLRGVDRARDELEIFMAQTAVSQGKPVLAVCRGQQVFNVALGGTLWQDLGSQMPAAIRHDHVPGHLRSFLQHDVSVLPDTKLACILASDRVQVNSLHHQGIRHLASELAATAYAPDGLIEGVEVPGHPFAVGVQWHPEELIHDDPAMLNLFRSLVEASGQALVDP